MNRRSLPEQIKRQREKLARLEEDLSRMMSHRVQEEEKLADLLRQQQEEGARERVSIPRVEGFTRHPCGDDEAPCVVCGRPVKLTDHPYFVWEHLGGGTAVTMKEGERLNAAGEEGGDLGGQPVGKACLRRHPQLKPFLTPVGAAQ